MLIPGQTVPDLTVTLVEDETYRLHERLGAQRYLILEVYRGAHCPICAAHLGALDARMPELRALGASALAVSMNDRDLALKAAEAFQLQHLPLGYGLDQPTARQWGLYLSSRIKDSEPAVFSEPATFVIQSDGLLYAADVRSSPHLRPDLDRLVTLVRRAVEGYPPRGALSVGSSV